MTTKTAKAEAALPAPGCSTDFLRRHSVKVIIQEAATRRYLSASGLWTSKQAQALAFRSGSAAIEHVNHRKLTKVRLVLTRAITFSEVIPVTKDLQG